MESRRGVIAAAVDPGARESPRRARPQGGLAFSGLVTLGGLIAGSTAAAWFFGWAQVPGVLLALATLVGLAVLGVGTIALRRVLVVLGDWAFSEPGRWVWATWVALSGSGAVVVWAVLVLAADLVGSHPGIGELQFLLLMTGVLGWLGSLAGSLYLARSAPLKLPVVGHEVSTRVTPIENLALLHRGESVATPQRVVIQPAPAGSLVGAAWELQRLALVVADDAWLAIVDDRQDSTTTGCMNVIHVASHCSLGCPTGVVVPGGTSMSVAAAGGGLLVISAMSGALTQSRLRPDHKPVQDALVRNRRRHGVSEVGVGPTGRIVRTTHTVVPDLGVTRSRRSPAGSRGRFLRAEW